MSDQSTSESRAIGGIAGFASLVPQIFYDLIARFTPGIVLISLIVVVIIGSDEVINFVRRDWHLVSSSFLLATVTFTIFITWTYTIAIALKGLVVLVTEVPKYVKNGELRYEVPNLSTKYDYIKLNNIDAGNRISKLNAEIHMTDVLLSGLVVTIAIGAAAELLGKAGTRLDVVAVAASLMVGGVGMRIHLRVRRDTAIENYSHLLGYKEPRTENSEMQESK